MKTQRLTAERKKELLEDGTYQKYSKKRRDAFMKGSYDLVKDSDYFEMSDDRVKDSEKIRRARKEQRAKIEKHIRYLFGRGDFDIYFGTFTFNDEALSLKTDTLKQSVRRLLTKCDDYILNIDYGAENERPHYHAVIALRHGTYGTGLNAHGHLTIDIFNSYAYGFTSFEICSRKDTDAKKLSRYIDKLTMHSVKVAQQYVSVKKGSDFQRYQKDQRIKSKLLKGSSFVNSPYMYRFERWKDHPQQERFIEAQKGVKNEQKSLTLNIV